MKPSRAISGIKPGIYEVSFDLEGFPAVSRRDVELRVGQENRLGAALTLEQIEEAITVTGEAPVIETTSKEIGGTLTTQEFRDLPTQNRSFALFAALLPGVTPVPSTESTSGDAIFANGQDDNNNSFNVDGANNDDDVIGARAGAQTRTPIEAIQEFQVLTSQFDAEFGRSTGAVLNALPPGRLAPQRQADSQPRPALWQGRHHGRRRQLCPAPGLRLGSGRQGKDGDPRYNPGGRQYQVGVRLDF